MNKILLTSFVMLATIASSANAIDVWAPAQLSKWGAQKAADCGGTGAEAGFKGDDVGTNTSWTKYLVYNWTYTGGTGGRDGYNAVYYLASTMYGHGYKFCKTIVAADRFGDLTQPRVVFYEPSATDCFVLCEEGYYGSTCSLRTAQLKTSSLDNFKQKFLTYT